MRKLYDKLSSGEIEHDGRFLVNFNKRDNEREFSSDEDDNYDQRKHLEEPEPAHDGEKWVEYKDSLGRTRITMKKDIPALKLPDEDLKSVQLQNNSVVDEPHIERSVDASNVPEEEQEMSMLSEDMRRELLRQKWEKEEEENLKKTKLHYRDVLFDEARTRGRGL